MQFIYKKSYLKRCDNYGCNEQSLIIAADREIRQYYITHKVTYGLRVKKLYDNGVEKENIVSFAVLGNHDEIRRYIKSCNYSAY